MSQGCESFFPLEEVFRSDDMSQGFESFFPLRDVLRVSALLETF